MSQFSTLPKARTWAKAERVYDALMSSEYGILFTTTPPGVEINEGEYLVGIIANAIQAKEDEYASR